MPIANGYIHDNSYRNDLIVSELATDVKDNRANISELEQEIDELEEALAVARELRRELFAQEDKAQRYQAVAKVLVETLNEGAWLMPSGMGLNVTALESRKVITEALEEYLKG